ncbi:YlbF family regulator [Halocatena halophila]|uniref:YlbF family regulator n=1 Tax=Halocatena halophila TaxID=2814576 RepID=UPI002ED63500
MSTETAAETDSVPEATVTRLASELGTAITDLPTYQAFIDAKARVENSEEAQQSVREFEQLREEFMLARQTGNATDEDLQQLQAAQEQLHDIPVMAEYLELQADLERELQELNKMISAPLAVDFGEKAGGCCQD